MLVFTGPPQTAPILAGQGFPDHEVQRLLHVLPAGMTLAREANGTPRLAISRYRDTTIEARGGLLHLELEFAALDRGLVAASAADGWNLRLVSFRDARARLKSSVPDVAQGGVLGNWSDVALSHRALLAENHLIDVHSIQMLDDLIRSGAGDVEVEIEARFDGLDRTLPVLVNADLAALLRLFGAHMPGALEGEAVTFAEIEAAALSAAVGSASPFRLNQLNHAGIEDSPLLRRLVALAIRDDLFARIDNPDHWAEPLYRLRNDLPEGSRSWDLSIARLRDRNWVSRWSLLSFLRSVPDAQRDALFPALSDIAPFERTELALIGPAGLDSRFVRRVQLDVTTTGPGGVPEQRSFVYPSRPAFDRLTVVYPAFTTPFKMSAQIAATLAPFARALPALPQRLERRALSVEGTAVRWSPADAGFAMLAVTSMPGLFDLAKRIEVLVLADNRPLCIATLTGNEPDATLAWPAQTAEVVAKVTAFREASGGHGVVMYEGPATASLRLRPDQLLVLDPDRVKVNLNPGSMVNAVYASITLLDATGRKRTIRLDEEQSIEWPCWRASRFDQLSYEYQIMWVPRLPDGTVLPLVVGEWVKGNTTELTIVLPVDEVVA